LYVPQPGLYLLCLTLRCSICPEMVSHPAMVIQDDLVRLGHLVVLSLFNTSS
jgi:hypothetical protein